MTELQKEEVTHNFMCRLSPEDHRKLKVIADSNNRSMTSQIRQFIQDDFRQSGSQMEEMLGGRIEQAEEVLDQEDAMPF
jgi:hypothetical protein|tara:strand:- start:326 stop:562 length:237 start_codon:yes stop_codon:yes gene_type:complete